MAGIFSQGGLAGHRYAGWLSSVEAKNFQFGGKVFNGSPSAIFVGSNLVWTYWLKAPAMTAIRGAFGVLDGTAVINATNAYLNQLAASDRDKATALAGFINEDPMMVCSLGLSVEGVTMPIRWLVGDGTAYIDTGYYANQTTHAICHAITYYSTNNPTIFGVRSDYTSHNVGSFYIGDSGAADLFILGYGDAYKQASQGADPTYYGEHLYDVYNGVLKVDGVARLSVTPTSFVATRTMGLFANNDGYMNRGFMPGEGRIAYIKLEDSVESHHYIPCKHNGQCGMYDIEGMTWYGNANSQGSFTIPDISYTPSTP